MQRAAAFFVGEHDFQSFAASDPDLTARSQPPDSALTLQTAPSPTTIRTIFTSSWTTQTIESGELLIYRVRGSGFLHHMIRNLVGTMLDLGRGQLHPTRRSSAT